MSEVLLSIYKTCDRYVIFSFRTKLKGVNYLFQGQYLNLDLSDIKAQAVSVPNKHWLI